MDNETKNKIDNLERQVIELTSTLETFKRDYAKHQHDNIDGTKILTKDIEIDVNNYLNVGYGEHGSPLIKNLGTVSLAFVAATKWVSGKPNFLAIIPAQIFPKFPLGHENTKGLFWNFNCL